MVFADIVRGCILQVPIPRTMQVKEPIEFGINDVDVNYSFRSSLGAMENNRYKQEIIGDIIYVDDVGIK